ncbi:hypothetical protein LK533_11005 [Sphingomonas sp. PL-96]|uniref:hypothetical protein n=1 Tax=Sphingomonas sp. PL-96 TaxID=2887201 RepID=UPI001E4A1F01|nr:hypothetical protein [Sphingomonas sp. PL-96]MCC2977198.1 hypothetical protein [Sphingomonas sp. PL-96]
MLTLRAMAGLGIGVLSAAGAVIAPALGAPEGTRAVAFRQTVPVSSIGGFTPSSADPKLAAILARSGIDGSSFRFTPSEGQRVNKRAVTVAVRARTQPVAAPEHAAVDTNVGPTLAPIAYNLGTSVGWKRFAAAGDLAKLDLGVQPGNRDRIGAALGKPARRTSSVTVAGDKPLLDQSKLVADAPSASIGVGGSYSLTRHFDVTAGLRYRSDKDRLLRLEDTRRDSQAVYVGTAFRF